MCHGRVFRCEPGRESSLVKSAKRKYKSLFIDTAIHIISISVPLSCKTDYLNVIIIMADTACLYENSPWVRIHKYLLLIKYDLLISCIYHD